MNQKGFVNIILILIIIAAVAGGTILFWNTRQEPVTQQTPTPNQTTQTPKTQPSASVGNKSDWKIYTNNQYGFELKYPPGWVAVDGGGLLNLEKRFLPAASTNPEVMDGFCKLRFYAFSDKLNNETIKDWLYRVRAEGGNPAPTNLTSVTFGSRTGLHEVVREIGLVNSIYLPLSDTSVLSTSLLCGDDVLKSGESEFNQILSTLKFTK